MSVYFAQVGQYIKIGYSTNPERRVRNLFASATPAPSDCPRDRASRRLIRYIDGTKSDEHAIQTALEDFCLGGEWFVEEEPVTDYIAAVEYDASGRCVYPSIRRPGGAVRDPNRLWTPADCEGWRRVLAHMTAEEQQAQLADTG